MSHWLGRQARFILAAFLLLTAGGVFALTHLPVSLFPTIQFPRIAVALEAGDRPVDQMEATVTRPVEDALRAVPGVRNIRSQTSRGSAEVSVTFDWGADIVTAALQSESELARLAPSLPAGFFFNVRRMDPTIFPVMGYSLTSNTLSQVELRTFAQYTLRPLLAAIDGVVDVSVLGGHEAEFEVLVDPARLQARGLSVADVESTISASNIVSASGRLEDRSRLYLTIVDDQLSGTRDIEEIVLRSIPGGGVISVADVADVALSIAPNWTRVTADGRSAVLVNIRQAPDANSLALTSGVKAALARETSGFPKDLTITPYYDQSDLVVSAAGSVRDAILIGTLLAGLVLFLFLRSLRLVLIVAILLPSVLAATALLLMALGQSLNIMTLGGMAAAVGLIVDDIVVMLEHIARRLSEGTKTVLDASSEMIRPLIGSSLATIVVFTPLAFLSGVTGGFFKALAITMASSLVFSMIFAMTVVPVLARFLTRQQDAERAERAGGWLDRIANAYGVLMKPLLQHARVASLALVAVALGAGLFSSSRIASGFMPQMDEGGFVLDYVAPAGLSLTETDRLVTQMEAIIQSNPDVASYSRRTGLQLGGGLTEANEGDLFIRLKPFPRRPIEDVMADLRRQVSETVPGLEIETIQLIGDVIGDLTAVPQPIEVKLFGNDAASLSRAADQALAALETVRGVVEVRKSDRTAGDAIVITLNRTAMALDGLDPASVSTQIETLVGGRTAGTILDGQRSLNIRLWSPEGLRQRVPQLEDLMLRALDGHLVPVERIAKVEIVSGQAQSSRENLQPMTAVTGRLEGRDMGSAMVDVRKAMGSVALPAGVRYAFGGLYAEQQKSFADLVTVFAAAFLLSGLLLVFLFRSLAQAASILSVVGLSVAGVLSGLYLTGTELNIAAMMGLTMVIGIIAELGIFYFAEIEGDAASHESKIEAGKARLRPILMSALIAILALSPLALKLGQGSALLAPMATAIISGLIIGAPLVLIAAPLIHAALAQKSPRPA
ncbi:MAG: efflux RND transporter permease subunit [Hyphomonas sp.]|uniref:efflux RND transporter permease subunit n=1 Tax=Hyphomonas sp. TaxID=87 RepID=UPI0017D5C034|nr:efflux RND transporter permease subunit [Hyphomonas sp.]MBA3070195.1 efflux RND transporter permease subunit [Hyphomonas sp.]MBU4060229.1 efflux RND transporter permease subunit [Alphaproteobacteria bacterium]MBU4162897.1 efflux RND transporter permease subunit [Alphaproteobacteria bacterium]